MPFIRDYAYSTSGATSSTNATCGVPNYAQNDLLVALISADGSLPANTTSVKLFSGATTAASGTGTVATLTFTAQTTAPYSVGTKIIVAGVTPTGYNGTYIVTACTTTTVSYANTTTGAQTVAGTVSGADWINVGYYSTAGTNACGMNVLVKYALATEPVDYTFTGLGSDTNNSMIISVGDVFQDGGGVASNAIENLTASTNVSNWSGTTYSTLRIGYPAISSTSNNSLVLYFGVSGGTGTSGGVPTANEGIAHLLIGKDGGSHSDGAAWSYKRASGSQAANTVYMRVSGNTSPAGFIAQLVVKPPAGGATIIPPYTVSDASKLISTGTGAVDAAGYGALTTATGANSTVFPTASLTLNSRPVVAGGTTYTTTDQGVNSFHSGQTITGVVTSGSWGSNVSQVPAMTDIANENILFHVSESTPVLGQPVDSVALSGACGYAFGLASTAGNCKVWHIHGNGTPWGHNRWIPCVVNTGNTSGVIGSAGTLNTGSIAYLGDFLSCKGIAGAYTVVSIWKMGVQVVAGGNSTRPFTDADLIPVCADAKERRSIVAQGANQYYVLQEVQFGNGGTDPIYLTLTDAAFEFPKQYDKTTRNTNYCSIDNKVGFTFYPGASDYISFKDCLFSSSSKYKWGFHASSGAATVVSTGSKVQGAGQISLANNINLSSMTFAKCDEITAATNTMTSIVFDASIGTNGAFTITGTDQTTLQTALNKLVTCTFSNNTVPLGALRIIRSSGSGNISLDMSGLKFSGNTADIRWECAAGSNLTINKLSGSNPSTYSATNSNQVFFQVSATLTLTDLQTGSDIVILDAGTETERVNVNANSGTTYNYAYTVTGNVDICVYKQGYIPKVERNYTLSGSDGSLPMKQTVDRNFSNPA